MGRILWGLIFLFYLELHLQSILGNFILLYARGDESKDKFKLLIGYFYFYWTFWLLPFWKKYLASGFWEVSSLSAIFILFWSGFHERAVKSILALFLASCTSMIFIASWFFFSS